MVAPPTGYLPDRPRPSWFGRALATLFIAMLGVVCGGTFITRHEPPTAFENRAPGLRHGLALDKHVTIILSESEGERPLCGIYFNLHSPYRKKAPAEKIA